MAVALRTTESSPCGLRRRLVSAPLAKELAGQVREDPGEYGRACGSEVIAEPSARAQPTVGGLLWEGLRWPSLPNSN